MTHPSDPEGEESGPEGRLGGPVPVEASGAAPRAAPPPALRPREFLRWGWRQLTSMRTALILLFLLAIASIPGSLIPQNRVDPSAVLLFKHRHPDLGPVFDRIGMFDVYSSIWFSAIYLLLFISLLGCIIPRLRLYLRAARAKPPKAPRNLSRLAAYATWQSDASVAEEVERARALLRSERRRVQIYQPPVGPADGDQDRTTVGAAVGATGGTVVSAEKGYLREAGNLVFHIAVVVVLIGFAFVGLFGFKGSAAVIAGQGFSNTLTQYDDFTPGARFNTNSLSPFSFTVQRFNVAYKQTGEGAGIPLHFDAHLAVTAEPGAAPYDYDLRVNHPLQVGGVSVFLVGHGYAPDITVWDAKGNIVADGPTIFLPQDGSFTSFGVIKAPDAKPTQLGLEGYFFPTAALGPGLAPYSSFPGPLNPVLSLVAYHGNLGLDTGIPQSVYTLDKDHLKPYRSAKTGRPLPLLLRMHRTVQLPDGAGAVRFNGLRSWVKLQINDQPGKAIPLVGVVSAIIGLLGSLFIRPRRTWVRVRDEGGRTVVEVAALDRVSGGDPASHVEKVAAALRPADQEERQ